SVGAQRDVRAAGVPAPAGMWPRVQQTVHRMGLGVGPDDMYLALRGLRTRGGRLARHYEAALHVARWLTQRPEVLRVLHPALETDPGHAVWRRDFSGASGLFSIVLQPVPQKAVNAFLDALKLVRMGLCLG